MRSSSLTFSSSEIVYGLVKVATKGTTVTIVSAPGNKIEITFSGTMSDGRLSGQMGYAAGGNIVSFKTDGVMVDDKISLTGQAQTADGTFQGSFSFTH